MREKKNDECVNNESKEKGDANDKIEDINQNNCTTINGNNSNCNDVNGNSNCNSNCSHHDNCIKNGTRSGNTNCNIYNNKTENKINNNISNNTNNTNNCVTNNKTENNKTNNTYNANDNKTENKNTNDSIRCQNSILTHKTSIETISTFNPIFKNLKKLTDEKEEIKRLLILNEEKIKPFDYINNLIKNEPKEMSYTDFKEIIFELRSVKEFFRSFYFALSNDEKNNDSNDEKNNENDKFNNESNDKSNNESNDKSNNYSNDEKNNDSNDKFNNESNDKFNNDSNDKFNDESNDKFNNKKIENDESIDDAIGRDIQKTESPNKQIELNNKQIELNNKQINSTNKQIKSTNKQIKSTNNKEDENFYEKTLQVEKKIKTLIITKLKNEKNIASQKEIITLLGEKEKFKVKINYLKNRKKKLNDKIKKNFMVIEIVKQELFNYFFIFGGIRDFIFRIKSGKCDLVECFVFSVCKMFFFDGEFCNLIRNESFNLGNDIVKNKNDGIKNDNDVKNNLNLDYDDDKMKDENNLFKEEENNVKVKVCTQNLILDENKELKDYKEKDFRNLAIIVLKKCMDDFFKETEDKEDVKENIDFDGIFEI